MDPRDGSVLFPRSACLTWLLPSTPSDDAQTWAPVWSSRCRSGLVQVISLWQNLSSHSRWQDVMYCSRYMFRASRFCSRAAYVHSVRSRSWGRGRETFTVTLTTRSCICTVVATTWRPPPVNSKTASLMSVSGCPLTDWAGSRHGQSSVTDCRPSLQLGADTVTAQDDVRLLGVTISSDLSLQRHVSNVSATSFNWLRQLRRVRRSLDYVWVSGYTCSRIRDLPRWPVQCYTCRGHEVCYSAACYERGRTCRQWQ